MSDMPPDSNGSGASPAEPDQPTQAPPRPATNGSRAVTSPPGLRCQRMLPSGSVTWSTGSRLATTTTGLSAPTGAPPLPPILPLTLLILVLLRRTARCAERLRGSAGPDSEGPDADPREAHGWGLGAAALAATAALTPSRRVAVSRSSGFRPPCPLRAGVRQHARQQGR